MYRLDPCRQCGRKKAIIYITPQKQDNTNQKKNQSSAMARVNRTSLLNITKSFNETTAGDHTNNYKKFQQKRKHFKFAINNFVKNNFGAQSIEILYGRSIFFVTNNCFFRMDNIVKLTGCKWITLAQDRGGWHSLGRPVPGSG